MGEPASRRLPCQRVVAALGFLADLGPVRDWGLQLHDNRHIVVDTRMRTNRDRVYAAGDIADYPGKVRLISVGLGEVATAVNNAAVTSTHRPSRSPATPPTRPPPPDRPGDPMTYVIAGTCIDVNDKACVDECPADCIYEGERKSYINPKECIDCGACEPVCPVQAITQDRTVPPGQETFTQDNRDFFLGVLPGRLTPLGTPGGSRKVGALGVDTALVSRWPAADE